MSSACGEIWTRYLLHSKQDLYHYTTEPIKGAGGVDDPGKVEIEFTVVPDRGECQLPDTFYQIKKYCS